MEDHHREWSSCLLYTSKDHNEAFASLKKLAVINPDEANRSAYLEAYSAWKEELKKL